MSDSASIGKSTKASLVFTKEGLAEHNAQLHAMVDNGEIASVVTLISHHGEIVNYDAYGVHNVAATLLVPVKTDSIFRIASMAKPITSAVMMMLWEEGNWKLEDPVSKFIPEFEGLKVRQDDGELVSQTSPMTMKQLLSHSAGFAERTEYPAEMRTGDLQAMIDYLVKQPLAFQPGTAWRYGPSVDIVGYIIEKLTGQQVEKVLDQRLFTPLGMIDSGYILPSSKLDRLVSNHTYDGKGSNAKLIPVELAGTYHASRPKFIGGGGGLMLSTVKDYWRFSQMILNGGEFEGKRYLEAGTVKLMHTNALKPGVNLSLFGRDIKGMGFGLGFAIVYDPTASRTNQGPQSFWWGGSHGTWFSIDPINEMIVVGFINSTNGLTARGVHVPQVSAKWVYQALQQET